MGVFLAKTEVNGETTIAGVAWTKAGAEGAQEVHPRLAHELMLISGDHFFVVEAPAKKAKAEEPKVEEPEAEEAPVEETVVAEEKPAPKRRTTPKE
jgi:hypothetical protein